MASNINVVLILMLAFYVSNGSLLLRPGQTDRQEHHLEQHQYRQSRLPKHESDDEADRWLLFNGGVGNVVDIDGMPPPRHYKTHRTVRVAPPWRKRNQPDVHAGGGKGGGGGGGGGGNSGKSGHHTEEGPSDLLPANLASQFMLRTPRGHRQYDVPQIECPQAEDGMDRFACPTPDRMGRYRCIDDHVLCDGFIDCPNGEDEDRQACMFYKTTKAHLDVLADALLRWARGR